MQRIIITSKGKKTIIELTREMKDIEIKYTSSVFEMATGYTKLSLEELKEKYKEADFERDGKVAI